MNRGFRRAAAASICALAAVALPACGQAAPPSDAQQQGSSAGSATPTTSAERDSAVARADRGRNKGLENAPVTVLEVSDFQCPFCRRFAQDTWSAVDSAYVRAGHARVVFINLPLPNHANAWGASEAALCAGAQDRFWPMHDRLFAGQPQWSTAAAPTAIWEGYARELGLDLARFRRCAAEDWMASLIVGDLTGAAGAGITATPTFVINAPARGAQGRRALAGALPFADFKREMDALLGR